MLYFDPTTETACLDSCLLCHLPLLCAKYHLGKQLEIDVTLTRFAHHQNIAPGFLGAGDIRKYPQLLFYLSTGARCCTWEWWVGKASIVFSRLTGYSQLPCLGLWVALQVWPVPSIHHQGWSEGGG
jgi:hypothetical protein